MPSFITEPLELKKFWMDLSSKILSYVAYKEKIPTNL